MGISTKSNVSDSGSSEYTKHPSPSYHTMEPSAILTLESEMLLINVNGRQAYHISRSLTKVRQEPTSIKLERKVPSVEGSGLETHNELVFYLVHPLNAEYQKDKPAYYATAGGEKGLGNIILEIQKKTLGKPEYKVLLNEGKSASSESLFVDKPTTVFTAKTGLMGGKYSWVDSQGKTIAQEDERDDKKLQLNINSALPIATRDALVASWCLKVWSDVAESREAKKDALERLTPAEGMSTGMGSKWSKRTGGMTALGGAGGGGC